MLFFTYRQLPMEILCNVSSRESEKGIFHHFVLTWKIVTWSSQISMPEVSDDIKRPVKDHRSECQLMRNYGNNQINMARVVSQIVGSLIPLTMSEVVQAILTREQRNAGAKCPNRDLSARFCCISAVQLTPVRTTSLGETCGSEIAWLLQVLSENIITPNPSPYYEGTWRIKMWLQ